MLQKMESSMLYSKMEDVSIEPLTDKTFMRIIRYMAKGHGILEEEGQEMIQTTVNRWVLAQMGFNGKTKPLLASWTDLWEAVMGTKSVKHKKTLLTAARVDLLLRTLDAWDLCEGAVMTEDQKSALWEEWVGIFSDLEIIPSRGHKLPTVSVLMAVSHYIDKFLPRGLFDKFHAKALLSVSSILLKRGYSSVNLSGTLYVVGGKLVHPMKTEEIPATATAATAVAAATAAVAAVTSDKKPLMVVTENVLHLGTF
jgi:hypothetical protein